MHIQDFFREILDTINHANHFSDRVFSADRSPCNNSAIFPTLEMLHCNRNDSGAR